LTAVSGFEAGGAASGAGALDVLQAGLRLCAMLLDAIRL
jgi:hypothetical protein